MTKLNLTQKLVLVGLMVLGIVFSCQKKEQPSQPIQPLEQNGITIDYSKASLQAGLTDSQKVDFDTPPMPIGGFEAIEKLLKFPESYKKYGVIFNVKIDENGVPKTISMKIPPAAPQPDSYRKGYFDGRINGLFDRIKWTPATKNEKPIAAWITLPIRYESKIMAEEIIKDSEKPPPPPPHPGEEDAFFVAYDEPPKPIGGFATIQQNLIYPEIARRAGIEGQVTIYARIGVNGEVVNTRILQSLGENNGCDEAAVAAIKAVKWQPAKAKGQPVSVWVSIPVKFKIQDKPLLNCRRIYLSIDSSKVQNSRRSIHSKKISDSIGTY